MRPRQVRLKLTKSQFHHCQKLSQESAKVWNSVKNFFWRTYRFVRCTHPDDNEAQIRIGRAQGTRHRKKGIWLSEVSMKRYLNGRFSLHSQSVQAIIEKFYDNLKSARSLRKDNSDIRYPHKNKGWFCVQWKKSALQVSGRYIHFSNFLFF